MSQPNESNLGQVAQSSLLLGGFAEQAQMEDSMDQKTEVLIEETIVRVRNMLGYVGQKEVMATLVNEGFKPEMAFLAIKAAQLCDE